MAAVLGACVWLWNMADIEPGPLFRIRSVYLFAAVVLLVLPAGVLAERLGRGSPFRSIKLTAEWVIPAWHDRSGVRNEAGQLARIIQAEQQLRREPGVVYVYQTLIGPALFFHLTSEITPDRLAVVPAGDLSVLLEPTEFDMYVVTDSENLGQFGSSLSESQLDTYRRKISTLTFLNLYTPSPLVDLDADQRLFANGLDLVVEQKNAD
jgi:hypothetical protein